MRDVGDEIAAGFLDALGFGQVPQYGDNPTTGHGSRRDIECASRHDGTSVRSLHVSLFPGGDDGAHHIGVAYGLDELRADPRPWAEAIHPAVCPLHITVPIDRDDRILHAIQQSFKLPLAVLQSREVRFHAADSAVERARYQANFVERIDI